MIVSKNRKVTPIPVVVKQKIPGRDSFQLWRDEYINQEYPFSLELFPKYPAAYRATEYDEVPGIDDTQTLTWPRRETLIPGCGNSGCNAYYTICEDLPPGNQPVGPANLYDSRGLGWYSGFGPFTVTSTGVCSTYWQHSHDQARNVFRCSISPSDHQDRCTRYRTCANVWRSTIALLR